MSIWGMTRARILREQREEREETLREIRAHFAQVREDGGALLEAIVRGHACCLINDPEFDQTLWDEARAECLRASRRGMPSALPESPKDAAGAVSREGET